MMLDAPQKRSGVARLVARLMVRVVPFYNISIHGIGLIAE